MQIEKFLNNFIFDTKLIEHSFLSEIEMFCIKSCLIDKKTFGDIAQEIKLTDERVRQIFENSMGKLLLNVKNLIAKDNWMQNAIIEKDILKKELADLKFKFKKELASEKQLEIEFKQTVSLSSVPFSVRARKALEYLQINSINELEGLELEKLNSTKRIGVKTIHEIINKAEEFGIKIK
jgi:hypothetical protein